MLDQGYRVIFKTKEKRHVTYSVCVVVRPATAIHVLNKYVGNECQNSSFKTAKILPVLLSSTMESHSAETYADTKVKPVFSDREYQERPTSSLPQISSGEHKLPVQIGSTRTRKESRVSIIMDSLSLSPRWTVFLFFYFPLYHLHASFGSFVRILVEAVYCFNRGTKQLKTSDCKLCAAY